jgi:NAD(P)-dependent dehydrogenase (short-subunit alcohol dehydrogenase family)
VHSTNAFLPLLRSGTIKKVLTLSTPLSETHVTLLGEIVGEPSYAISKAAVNMVVAKYAAQFKSEGFTFLTISPGMVNTSILPSPSFIFLLNIVS